MITLPAKSRTEVGKKYERNEKNIPAVLYGPKIKNQPIEIDLKEFKKVYHKAGESSLISLEIDSKKFSVLIHDYQQDAISGEFKHVDFYQPILTEEIEVNVPLVFIGEAPAIKDLAGTLVKEFQEIAIKALPESLPHEITVDVSGLKTFDDIIFVKDLKIPAGVKIQKEPDAIVAKVVPPQKVEEELEKPITEDVEGVEVVEKDKKEGEEETAETEPAQEKTGKKDEK